MELVRSELKQLMKPFASKVPSPSEKVSGHFVQPESLVALMEKATPIARCWQFHTCGMLFFRDFSKNPPRIDSKEHLQKTLVFSSRYVGVHKWGYLQIIHFNRMFSTNHPFWGYTVSPFMETLMGSSDMPSNQSLDQDIQPHLGASWLLLLTC